MKAVRRALDRGLGWLLAALMATAVLNVVWQVFSRYALGQPSTVTDELARTLLVWIGLVGAATAAGRQLHVAVDLLPRTLPAPLERALDAAVQLVVLAFALAVMVGGGAGLVSMSFELGQRSAALGLPMGAVYAAVPLAGVVVASFAALRLLEVLTSSATRETDGGSPAP